MKDKPVTIEDYEKYSGEFFDKYFYVAKQLGEGAKAEDILKIMESLAMVVMKKRMEEEGCTPAEMWQEMLKGFVEAQKNDQSTDQA